jgi:hydroxyacylglutathione hydrolase
MGLISGADWAPFQRETNRRRVTGLQNLSEAPWLIYSHATGNALGNIDYLIACPETGECVAVDPWDAEPLLQVAEQRGWTLRRILNTHAHWDHTRGNADLIERTGAQVFCHPNARKEIGQGALGLQANTHFQVGFATLRVLHTPGHTLSHICLLAEAQKGFLISGDTLFNAGAGNCHNGGDPEQLFETFETLFSQLSGALELLPGHDYLAHNLGFSLDREPENQIAQSTLRDWKATDSVRMTLAQERLFNPFLRLDAAGVVEGLKEAFPKRDFSSRKERFLALRELRNRW